MYIIKLECTIFFKELYLYQNFKRLLIVPLPPAGSIIVTKVNASDDFYEDTLDCADINAVATTGTQTISGVKTFSAGLNITYTPIDNNHVVNKLYVDNIVTSGITVGTMDGVNKSSNGAIISGGNLYLQTASGTTYPGLISTGTQTIGGVKTFTSPIEGTISGSVVLTSEIISRALYLDPSGTIKSHIDVTSTELGYLSNVTSDIQTQLNSTVKTSGTQTISGTKTFTSSIDGDILGNAGTVTSGVYTAGNQTIGGNKTFSSETYFTSSNAYRSVFGSYGTFWRNDGTNLYLMVTSGGDQYGGWTTDRPLQVSLSTGVCNINGNAATVSNGVYTAGNQTIAGIKTFSSTIVGDISGNSATVTDGVYITGSQTIGGTKTFSNNVFFSASAYLTGDIRANGASLNIYPNANNYAVAIYGGNGSATSAGAGIIVGGIDYGNGNLQLRSSDNGVIQIGVGGNNDRIIITTAAMYPDAANNFSFGTTTAQAYGMYSARFQSNGTDCQVGTISANNLLLYTGGSYTWAIINSDGTLRPAVSGTQPLGNTSYRMANVYSNAFNATANPGTSSMVHVDCKNTSYASNMVYLHCDRSSNTAYEFLWTGAGASDVKHWLRGDGAIGADNTTVQAAGDYGEFFEVSSGIGVIEVGTTVILDESNPGMIRPTASGDSPSSIFGVVRPKPKDGNSSICGNHPLNWPRKYLRDDYGRNVTISGELQLNPDYDPEQTYTIREARDEWHVVGLVGQVPITKGQLTNPNWVKIKDISDTVELWLIR